MTDSTSHDTHGGGHGLTYELSKLTVPLAILAILVCGVWVDHRLTRATPSHHKKLTALRAPALGATNPKLDLIFFTDFNALNPNAKYAIRGWQLARRIVTEFPESVRLQVRFHYTTRAGSTPSAHRVERLLLIARSAYAAHRQGQFWSFVDWALGFDSLLEPGSPRFQLSIRQPLSKKRILAWVKGKHLDLKQFRGDVSSKATLRFIESELGVAKRLGLTKTNLFLLNGRQLQVRELTFREFALEVNKELARFTGISSSRMRPRVRAAAIRQHLNDKSRFLSYLAYIERGRRGPRSTIARPSRVHVPVDPKRDAVQGPDYAPVTVVVFSDFQCGYCARAVKPLHELQRRHGKHLRVVFKHFPLQFHRRAYPAAVAALAAQKQNKFWAYHNLLFGKDKFGSWTQTQGNAPFVALAKELGLNLAQFSRDIADPSLKAHVQADVTMGNTIGVRGTPTLFVNGYLLRGLIPSELEQLVAREKERVNGLIARGVPLAKVYETLTGGKLMPVVRPPRRRPQLHNLVLEKQVPGTRRVKPKFNLGNSKAPTKGSSAAKVVITLFTDLSSDKDAKLSTPLDQYVDGHKDSVRLIVRHLPSRRRRASVRAALAALAAHMQGRYWPYRETLIANRGKLSKKDLFQYAKDNKLDLARFAKDLGNRKLIFSVVGAMRLAKQHGINATPAVLINGKPLRTGGTPLTVDDIKQATHKLLH